MEQCVSVLSLLECLGLQVSRWLMGYILCFSSVSQRAPLLVDGSYQSLEALPIEHLQIVFVASSSCSEDDSASTSTATSSSATATASAPVCQERPAAKKNSSLPNGFASATPSKVHDGKAKGKMAPRHKIASPKRAMARDGEKSKKAEAERKTGVEEEVLDGPPDGWPLRRVISIEEDHLPHLLQGGPQPLLHQLSEEDDEDDEEEDEAQSDLESSVVMAVDLLATPPSSQVPVSAEAPPARKSLFARTKKAPTSPRRQPVGKETQHVRPPSHTNTSSVRESYLDSHQRLYSLSLRPLNLHQKAKEAAPLPPERLFKVVLVGNSSVGKTSLLRSFCEGRFHPATTATVGEKNDVVMLSCVHVAV